MIILDSTKHRNMRIVAGMLIPVGIVFNYFLIQTFDDCDGRFCELSWVLMYFFAGVSWVLNITGTVLASKNSKMPQPKYSATYLLCIVCLIINIFAFIEEEDKTILRFCWPPVVYSVILIVLCVGAQHGEKKVEHLEYEDYLK